MEFKSIKASVAKQFALMSKHSMYRSAISKDELWDTYLSSFPEGTNPIYKTRTEHDCNCCKQFIRAVGDVVAIIDGKVVSIWDGVVDDPAYQAVSSALSAAVKAHPIQNIFLHPEKTAGTDKSIVLEEGRTHSWNHFFVNIPANFVMHKDLIAMNLGEKRAAFDVFQRGLNTLTLDALDAVLELISQNTLYRGEEHKQTVTSFKNLLIEYNKITDETQKTAFVWGKITNTSGAVLKIRNTSIGTLLINISEGKDIEHAVKAFESIVAPANYKRPKSIVTKSMIESAKTKINELGLGSALERRYATLEDISINEILYANRNAQKAMKSVDVFEELASNIAVSPKSFDKVEEVPLDRFLKDVLPTAKSLEVMMENRHSQNLVSLVAPVDPTAERLFKWGNNFSWSYNGDVADSLREKVAAAGGRVDGVLRFSHSWNHVGRNASLMDLHVFMPGCSNHADGVGDRYPGEERVGWNKRSHRASGGIQDVDYVDAAPEGYVPVENITFPSLSRLKEGKYVFKIHNWNLRQPTTSGFKAEIEFEGQVFEYEYPRPLGQKEWVTVAEATLKNGKFTIDHKIPVGQSVRQVWGVSTNNFQKVNVVMTSPNFWEGQGVGNKHLFFMLEDCKNEGTARGFYNEFLKEELTPHRKVIDMVGAKMRAEESDRQLSGLGFSSTQRNNVIVKVTGAISRVIKVVF